MKLGIYSSIANPPRGEDLDRCVQEVIEEAQLAEELGFDSCFFGEHHQDADGFLPSPLIVATAVAASTKRLRMGTSVILLPLHHPVHVAEDVVTLDIVSRGRIILGVGLGYQEADFRAFGIPMEHRVELFEEGVDIIRRCWTGETFSFHLLPREAFPPGRSEGASAPIPAAVPTPVDRRQRIIGGAQGWPPGGRLRRWAQRRSGHRGGTGANLPRVRRRRRPHPRGGYDEGRLGGVHPGRG